MKLWPSVPTGTEEILKDRKCPACGSTRTHRSHPRGRRERWLRAYTPLRPFSCSACKWRGWRLPYAADAEPLPPILVPPSPPRPLPRTAAAAAHRRESILFGVTVVIVVALFLALLRR